MGTSVVVYVCYGLIPMFTYCLQELPPQQLEGTSKQLSVKETDLATITKEHLYYVNVGDRDDDVVYTVTSQPYFLTTSITIDAGRIISTHNITAVKVSY